MPEQIQRHSADQKECRDTCYYLFPSSMALARFQEGDSENQTSNNFQRKHALACRGQTRRFPANRPLSVLIALSGGLVEQAVGFAFVLWHSVAVVIQVAKDVLRTCIALFGGFSVPTCRFGVILWHSFASVIQKAEALLGPRVTLFSGFATPTFSLHIVLW